MVTRWGMSDRGMIQRAPRENPYRGGAGGDAGEKPISEATAEAVDAEVHKILEVTGAGRVD
jgi:ATP-dependent Zn protease